MKNAARFQLTPSTPLLTTMGDPVNLGYWHPSMTGIIISGVTDGHQIWSWVLMKPVIFACIVGLTLLTNGAMGLTTAFILKTVAFSHQLWTEWGHTRDGDSLSLLVYLNCDTRWGEF